MSNLDLSLYRSIEALADNDIPNPILRIDFFLHAVITGEECNIEPVTKTEEYLYALATGDESRLGLYGDSISLLEEYLEALRTGDTSNLREPRTREEIILYQAITGEDLGVEPVSRIETYLSMLQNAGGLDYILSTSTNASVIPLTNSINGKARVQEMCGNTVRTRLDVSVTDGLVCLFNDNGYKLQSCGQDDENGHKIEILSQNKNLLLPTARDKKIPIFLKKGTTLTLSTKDNAISNGGNIMMYDVNGEVVWFAIDTGRTSVTRTLPRDIYYIKDALSYNVNYELKYQLEISNTKTSYVEPEQNKKEILLNEPLRGLPNGVQDRIVYLDENTTPIAPKGKGLYLEKNVGEVVLSGSYDWVVNANTNPYGFNNDYSLFYLSDKACNDLNLVVSSSSVNSVLSLSDRFPTVSRDNGYDIKAQMEYIHCECICIKNSRLSTRDFAGFKKWLADNPTTMYYTLRKPTYTKISDVNFECYENATVYVDSGVVAPTKTVIRYPYKQPALFSL